MKFKEAQEIRNVGEVFMYGQAIGVSYSGTKVTDLSDLTELDEKTTNREVRYCHEQKDVDGARAWKLSKGARRKAGLSDPEAVFREGEGESATYWSV